MDKKVLFSVFPFGPIPGEDATLARKRAFLQRLIIVNLFVLLTNTVVCLINLGQVLFRIFSH